MPNNIFVMGLDDFNRVKLEALNGAEEHVYHGLLDPADFYETEVFPLPDMLRRARERLDAFEGRVDAIVGYMDFPVSTMLPILCREYGTRSTSLESLLKCEHKYWSRVVQREVIPENIPRFAAFDPFDDEALVRIGESGLGFPFFVKPIKSSGSRLGFRVDDPQDFEQAIGRLRAEIDLISEPFNHVLEHASLPEAVRAVHGGYCMAEEIIGGHQCTVEGYVHEGEVVPYGLVDSIRYPQVISFLRYEYPSRLPEGVRERMFELTRTVMAHTGFDHSAFNIEFFWDEPRDQIWLLEINTRISQSHCDLFEKVDGVSHQQVTIDLGLGRRPDMPRGQGAFAVAAKWFYRVFFADATVKRVPRAEELEAIARRFPGTVVALQVSEGMRLSGLPEQDSYSYALAYIWMGAGDPTLLERNYERILSQLTFDLEDIPQSPDGAGPGLGAGRKT